ncbi:MAG TPA: S8 family peptidase [Planctomycetaceae bacterium]|nr:S8 family peptidase [Planctomycetaceae bacterium]
MIGRIAIAGAVLLAQLFFCDVLHAEKFRIAAKPSKNKRLAPELDVLRECNGKLTGFCKCGKPVIDVPPESKQTLKAMALTVDENPPPVTSRPMRLLLSYDAQSGKPAAETLEAAHLRAVDDYQKGQFLVVEPIQTVSAQTVDVLMSDDAVVHAAPDYVLRLPDSKNVRMMDTPTDSDTPTDPLYGRLWGMKNINANRVWNSGHRTAPNIVVAVIDTGVDYNHPDLKNNMWTKNGSHGFDFFDDDSQPMDEQGHGTHCAGTIAGEGNNNVGVVGVCWKAQIMAMRFLGPDGSGATSDAVKCIDWAVANGAHVLSNSWAGPDNSVELNAAISRAEAKGVLFVAAAGNTVNSGNNNDARPFYPASCPNQNIISVAAIDVNNAIGTFSHYGVRSVDIGAPGVGIVSCMPNNRYAELDGTSMACPHVAGAAALIWAKAFANPAQSPAQMTQVRDLILHNARPLSIAANRWGQAAPARVPGGVLDLSFMINGSSSPSTPTPVGPRFVERRAVVDPIKLR